MQLIFIRKIKKKKIKRSSQNRLLTPHFVASSIVMGYGVLFVYLISPCYFYNWIALWYTKHLFRFSFFIVQAIWFHVFHWMSLCDERCRKTSNVTIYVMIYFYGYLKIGYFFSSIFFIFLLFLWYFVLLLFFIGSFFIQKLLTQCRYYWQKRYNKSDWNNNGKTL